MQPGDHADKPLIALRIVLPNDHDFLFRVYAGTRAHEPVSWSDEEEQNFLKSQFLLQTTTYEMKYPDATHRIITYNDIDIGRVIFQAHDDHLHMIDLSILPEYRGRGVGTDLLSAFLAQAQGGKVPVRLMAEKLNPVLRLYHRLGFKQIGTTPSHVSLEWQPNLNAAEI